MKKLILSLLFLASFLASAKDNINLKLSNSLLWKISGNEITQPSYLYGTMHLICDKTTLDKVKVQNAVDATEQLYLEVDMFNPTEAKSIMKLMASEVKIKDLPDLDKKQQLLTLAEEHLGMKGSLIENTTLFTVFSMMAYKATDGCSAPTSVEEMLEAKYKHDRSKIAGLETMAQQMEFIRDSGVANLENTIIGLQEFDEMKQIYVEMNEKYLSENISELYAMMIKPSELYSQEYIDTLLEILLKNRNENWVKQIPQIASETPTLFAVGAGHLPGQNGVINLLRKAGYSVEAVMD